MRSVAAIVAVIVVVASVAPPAFAQSGSGSWLDWLGRLWQWLQNALQVVSRIRSAIDRSVGVWWENALPQVSTVLGTEEMGGVLQYLLSLASSLPGNVGRWVGRLYDWLVAQAGVRPPEGSAEDVYRRGVSAHPVRREVERQSLGRQVQAVRLVVESEATRQGSEEVAQQVVTSTVAQEAAASALERADVLQQSVQDAQSSRALLQYLGEGVADLMRQQATLVTVVVQNLQALNQQSAMTNREMQLVVTALAQQLLNQEREKQAKVRAMQEAARAVGEGYGKSIESIGRYLVGLQDTSGERMRKINEAITPR
jgi:hypothetical protein